ncbi:coadhesin-like [Ruditapes philippinarum]|uniref:coadhesin-like n=1 Tax=Ruditapes philippinarum TaxID=129788 RepID=UPI00295AED1F|nr:coadhesin-like [Ruditapes philippinarum]
MFYTCAIFYSLCDAVGIDFCLVDGQWSGWSTWSSCSVTCGNGKRTKIRTCTNPAPTSGGLNCTGSDTRVTACKKQPCSAVSTRTTTVVSQTSTRPTRTTTMDSMKGNVKLCPERIQQLAAGSRG